MTGPTVGVNLLWLVPGVVGGSEEYTLRLLRAYDEVDEARPRLRVYGQPALFEAHPDLVERFGCVAAPRRAVGSKPGRIAAEHTWLARVSRHDDVVHHAGGVVPAIRSTPAIVTVHDLQPLELPAYFSQAKRRWLATMIPRSVAAARLVVSPSRFTAERITVLLGVPTGKVRVVHHGHARCEPGVDDPAIDADLRHRFGPYLLYPAITYPHKRHADLVEAVGLLRDRYPNLAVVITGRAGPEATVLERQAAGLGLRGRVHQLGRVPEAELDALYRSAVALVFPSEYEGFGNPVLEAMARGCPVVCADTGALPEVAGPAGLVVPVRQPSALATAIGRVLDEPGLRQQLSKAGLAQAQQFSWSASGRQLADAYRHALDRAAL